MRENEKERCTVLREKRKEKRRKRERKREETETDRNSYRTVLKGMHGQIFVYDSKATRLSQ